jgi:hypothetical protein
MHWSLDKDSPASRSIQRIGNIKSHPILGGLHHHNVHLGFQYTQQLLDK